MIRSSDLDPLPGVRHGFFTRREGVSEGIYASLNCGLGSGDAPERVRENRARAMARLGVPAAPLCTPHQVHGTGVVRIEAAWAASERPRADAVVTDRPGLALGVLTADCAPLLLADPAARVVGAAHAGWKGALAGVVEAVVAAMAALGAEPAHICAAIGPCILQASYEVGPEFPGPFLAQDRASEAFFAPAAGRYRFDLPGYLCRRLAACGIAAHHVAEDTCADAARFFSYRRTCKEGGGDYGRLLSAIVLEG